MVSSPIGFILAIDRWERQTLPVKANCGYLVKCKFGGIHAGGYVGRGVIQRGPGY